MRELGLVLLAVLIFVLAIPWIGMIFSRLAPHLERIMRLYVDWVWSF